MPASLAALADQCFLRFGHLIMCTRISSSLSWILCIQFLFGLILKLHSIKCMEHKTCECKVETNTFETVNNSIVCSLTTQLSTDNVEIPCQKVANFIAIGPVTAELITKYTGLSIAPWAFSNLFLDKNMDSLQLDVDLKPVTINALAMGGLTDVRIFQAHTSLLTWDSCTFADLDHLEQVTLNCKSHFGDFLTFGKAISMIRLVNCLGIPFQFYCVRCLQNPQIRVIRIRPGPPLTHYLIKFSQLDQINSSQTDEFRNLNDFHLPKCPLDVCSDSVLCRTNDAFKQYQLRKLSEETLTTVASIPGPVFNSSGAEIKENEKLSGQIYTSFPPSTEPFASNTSLRTPSSNDSSVMNSSSNNGLIIPMLSTNYNFSVPKQKVWIASSILTLIVICLFTLCILIALNRQRTRRRRLKLMRRPPLISPAVGIQPRTCLDQHCLPNGSTHESLIKPDEENRIELPELP